MPSLIDMRRRIRAVENTQQITKAMKMVAASKLRRAQARVMGTRPFAKQPRHVLASIAARVDQSQPPLLAQRPGVKSGKTLLIVMTSDKGLCGAFNNNIIFIGATVTLPTGSTVAVAETASYLNTLNQNLTLSGSLTILNNFDNLSGSKH